MSYRRHIDSEVYDAEGAITKFRFVKAGSTPQQAIQASAAADKLIGVNRYTTLDTKEVSIDTLGIAELELGASVAAGDLLMSDASGRGILAAAASGVNIRYGGVAKEDGVLGDIVPVRLVVGGSFQG